MGVLLNKKTGNYYIRFNYNGRDHEKVIGQDKRAAEIALAEVKNEIRIAKLNGQGWDSFAKLQRARRPKTFAEAAQEYMEERTNFKASSIAAYNSILKANLLPEFGNRSLTDISETIIRKYMAALSKKGTSESRINTIMQLFRSIIGQCYRKGEIPRDPCLAVKRLQEPRVKIDPFAEDDLRLALSCVDAHYRAFFTAQAYTGARPNELQALRWSDIDWKNEQISITKGLVRGKEGLPKTKSGERLIPMTPPVKRTLLELKAANETTGVFSLQGFVFTTPSGTPIIKHMDRVWARALNKAKLRHRPSYQLRHTFVTQCIINGFPLPYVAKIIGHSTIDTLIRHYTKWIDKATQEQEARLRQMFAEEPQQSARNQALLTAV